MADINDIQGIEAKFEGQLDLLAEADIEESDRDAIRAFARDQDAKGIDISTITNHLSQLRLSAERADIPLTEMEKTDLDDLFFNYKHERGMAEGTLRNYRKSFRKFTRFQGRDWSDDVKIGPSPNRNVDPDDLLTQEELDDLLEAAPNSRDRALIAVLADTAQRVTAVASLTVGSVDLTGSAGRVTLNTDADGLKGTSGTFPLTWSKPHVADWLNDHPRQDDPDAPLFINIRRRKGDGDGALSYQHLHRRLKEIASLAEIPEDKVNPHNFRKTAITQWVRDGLSEQEIKHRAGWAKDSGQFEIYAHVTEEQMNRQILDQYGLSEDDEMGKPTLEQCPQCQTPLRDSIRFCPACGLPLSQDAARTVDQAEEDILEDIVDASDSDLRAGLKTLLNSIKDPHVRAALDDDE